MLFVKNIYSVLYMMCTSKSRSLCIYGHRVVIAVRMMAVSSLSLLLLVVLVIICPHCR